MYLSFFGKKFSKTSVVEGICIPSEYSPQHDPATVIFTCGKICHPNAQENFKFQYNLVKQNTKYF